MRCLIVDDEEPARRHLQALLAGDPSLEIVAQAASGEEALRLASSSPVDVVFLDIEMPALGGLEVARSLVDFSHPPSVVFLTGHGDHALEAFDIGATDYLLKPVRRDRLRQTLQRLRETRATSKSDAPIDRVLLCHPVTQAQEVVSLDEVSWFTANGDHVWAVVKGENFRVSQPLSRLEATLPGDQFIRTHKAYLVNLGKVRRLICLSRRTYVLQTACGQELPLSRHYLEAFRSKIPGL